MRRKHIAALNNMHIDRQRSIMHLELFIREILAKYCAYKLVN